MLAIPSVSKSTSVHFFSFVPMSRSSHADSRGPHTLIPRVHDWVVGERRSNGTRPLHAAMQHTYHTHTHALCR